MWSRTDSSKRQKGFSNSRIHIRNKRSVWSRTGFYNGLYNGLYSGLYGLYGGLYVLIRMVIASYFLISTGDINNDVEGSDERCYTHANYVRKTWKRTATSTNQTESSVTSGNTGMPNRNKQMKHLGATHSNLARVFFHIPVFCDIRYHRQDSLQIRRSLPPYLSKLSTWSDVTAYVRMVLFSHSLNHTRNK